MKLFDRGWDHVGAKTWVANPARSASSTYPHSTQASRGSSSRPSSRLDSARPNQVLDDQARKLKEIRLAELTRQLELTELQNHHHHPVFPPPPPLFPPLPISRPITPISKLSVEKERVDPVMTDEDLIWQQKVREAQDLNDRIESLRRSGIPQEELPSPVLLPSRPLFSTRTDKLSSTCPPPPRDFSTSSFPSEAVLRHQPSKRSLHSSSSHPSKSSPGPPPTSQSTSQSRDRSASTGQAGYYQALKEAQDVISKLRKSHDELLEKVRYLENQLELKETEILDLNTRNSRLETYVADEQKIKEEIQRENERAMSQVRSLSRSQSTHHLNRPEPPSHLQNSHTPPLPQERAFRVPPIDQNSMSRARVELLKREENLQRQYGHRAPSCTPELTRPASNLAHRSSPAPMTNPSQAQSYYQNLYGPTNQPGQSYHLPPHSHPLNPTFLQGEHPHLPPHLGYPAYDHSLPHPPLPKPPFEHSSLPPNGLPHSTYAPY
ncbi:hypothetical protein PCANC_04811 [Puccinia coronata f. sp. avenae]|uniref:Uncharacterized protein n=1 Tax=Puccinia coronata f. sp. avenae TaxID=200324 RepID=A0A2N5VCI2_9BASI|nr:hypothetical protein PCASD_04111 [Puccinia coronata f. sp. avenae]PLW56499.1 hypothetical protein PCANC_04811 [Puccinia coronata f. sp. avenae]